MQNLLVVIILAIFIGVVVLKLIYLGDKKKMEEFDELSEFEKEKRERNEVEFFQKEKSSNEKKEFDNVSSEIYKDISENNSVKENFDDRNEIIIENTDIIEDIDAYNILIDSIEKSLEEGEISEAENSLEKLKTKSKMGYYENGKYYFFYKLNRNKAEENFNIAYKKGIVRAAYYLGLMELDRNKEKAEKYYESAIEDTVYAANELINIYEEKNDLEKLEKCLIKVTENKKNARFIYELAKLYFGKNDFEKIQKLKEELTENTEIMFLEKNILLNLDYMLGNENDKKYISLIIEGEKYEDEEKYEDAVKCYEEALKYNDYAYMEIARMIIINEEDITKFNIKDAVEAYKKAFEKGIYEAAMELGDYFRFEENYEEAQEWYEKGYEVNDPGTIFTLGWLQTNESHPYRINEKDLTGLTKEEIGLKLYRKAAEMNFTPAIYQIMINPEVDEKEKKEWAKKILTQKGVFYMSEEALKIAKDIFNDKKIMKEITAINYSIARNKNMENTMNVNKGPDVIQKNFFKILLISIIIAFIVAILSSVR